MVGRNHQKWVVYCCYTHMNVQQSSTTHQLYILYGPARPGAVFDRGISLRNNSWIRKTRRTGTSWNFPLPSSKCSHNYGKSPFSMSKSTIIEWPFSTAILSWITRRFHLGLESRCFPRTSLDSETGIGFLGGNHPPWMTSAWRHPEMWPGIHWNRFLFKAWASSFF